MTDRAETPRDIWEGMSDAERRAAINTREPVSGVLFRMMKARKTGVRYIEANEDGAWVTLTLAPAAWKSKPLRALAEEE